MKKLSLLVPALLSLVLVGCFEPKVTKIEEADAQKVVDSFIYKKDKNTGICYGVLETKRMSTNFTFAQSLIVTYVPCSEIPEFQTEKDKLENSVSNTVNSLLGK